MTAAVSQTVAEPQRVTALQIAPEQVIVAVVSRIEPELEQVIVPPVEQTAAVEAEALEEVGIASAIAALAVPEVEVVAAPEEAEVASVVVPEASAGAAHAPAAAGVLPVWEDRAAAAVAADLEAVVVVAAVVVAGGSRS